MPTEKEKMLRGELYRGASAQLSRERAAQSQSSNEPSAGTGPAKLRDLVARARTLTREGRHGETIAVLSEAVRGGPYVEGLHYMLGDTMSKHATPAEMVAFWSEEALRDEKPQTSHYFWSIGLSRDGDIDGAIAQLKKALEIDPGHELSQRQWGILLEEQGKYAQALEHFSEAVKIHPDFRLALEDAARVAERLGKANLAKSFKDRAAAANPNTMRRFIYWARYLHEKGRHAAALTEIQHLLDKEPNDAEALEIRANVRAALGYAAPLPSESAPKFFP
jgi:tetratricopeptide (TPR) repeat protein